MIANILQRDLLVDGSGLRPVTEAKPLPFITRKRRAIRAVFRRAGRRQRRRGGGGCQFTRTAATRCRCVTWWRIWCGGRDDEAQPHHPASDITGALSRSGFEDIASNILNMLRQRVTGDYLQTRAILVGSSRW